MVGGLQGEREVLSNSADKFLFCEVCDVDAREGTWRRKRP